MIRTATLLLASLIGIASAPATFAADPVQVYIEEPGICGNEKVLSRISHRFRYQVRHVPNLPQVDIVDFRRINERRYEPQAPKWPIERRYCHATVDLSNGHSRDVWYLIEKPMGFVGIGSNVEFCVSGFDRWNVYGGRCRSLQ